MRVLFVFILLLLTDISSSEAQYIRGSGTIRGAGTITLLDNCTAIKDGQTGTPSNTDKNYKHWFATRITITSDYEACHVAQGFSKVGNPAGTVKLAVFANAAGQPGTMLFETAPISADKITEAFSVIVFSMDPQQMVAGTDLWVAIYFSDTVSFSAVNDYYMAHSTFTGNATDTFYVSDDGVTWADGGSRSFLYFQFRGQAIGQ